MLDQIISGLENGRVNRSDNLALYEQEISAALALEVTDHRFWLRSFDDALFLHKTILPNWTAWEVRSRANKTWFTAIVSRLRPNARVEEEQHQATAKDPAYALTVATLKAFRAQQETDL